MDKLYVKKIRPEAHLPERAKSGDLGYDLFSAEKITISPGETKIVKTGIAVEFPDGWGALIRDRSSMAVKQITTSAGVIDNGYRGEIGVVMTNHSDKDFMIEVEMKIAQMIPTQVTGWDVVEKDSLNDTDRGGGGFGSTGTHKES